MAQVMQQGCGDQFIAGAFGLAERCGLQSVLQLRDGLAAVLLAAALFKQPLNVGKS
ncbi:hypothetical protein LP414_14605 [Polaromonas sp. P1(28)-13]|nr:hypothetical protein LP417_15805 [Polaromonas sp. P1-6]UUZ70660.1 hypothetical protein LP416_12800 [Polaromonas sp. P2-4]UUZ78680.1 hypothetical protein LP414_14605 [Polaromonas sp. P1(28)-13]